MPYDSDGMKPSLAMSAAHPITGDELVDGPDGP
ncbi:hypothetical protein STVIR_4334 [Streptomyces viridochromogenes Tue57]|uniref:Uncharacterized protein n=1 Tax=Streptomyces viridochromogenes Tue57 TaxID=1160705 RepID=L8PAW5_STRVR|nr:hypothetical protein STVIR_4334 [Streptomyces viridochromogenes Tue57]